jgi:hypothetical protein
VIVPADGSVSVIVSDRSFSPASTSETLRPPNRFVAPALSFRLVAVSDPDPLGLSLMRLIVTVVAGRTDCSPPPP